MPGTGEFGVFKLGLSGALVTLPELSEFHSEPVLQGGMHTLLNGKARTDDFGSRRHFFLGWKFITEAEADIIDAAVFQNGQLVFEDATRTLNVVRGNHSPWTYNLNGTVNGNLELDEC